MLDIKFIREYPEQVKKAVDEKVEPIDIDYLLEVDEKVKALRINLQDLNTQRNTNAKQIPEASPQDRPGLIQRGREIGAEIDTIKPSLKEQEDLLGRLLSITPAIPDPEAPRGSSEADNVEIKQYGKKPDFSFEPRDHVELLEQNNWAEFKRIAKVCGSRSYGLRDAAVWLEMAIHRLAFDILYAKGFSLISTPALVKEDALFGTGHFPMGRDQVYCLKEDELFLSGTSEVQINYLHSGEILQESELPILYAGRTACFRREAGSYGRDVRGLMRVHEFTKVEQYVICKNDPEESRKWHQKLLETSEEIVRELELPYRIVECCTGDMGTGKVRMYDVECWVPSEKKYRETHSCSSLHDWQARRTNTRYRDKKGNVHFVHTLNNTAIATPRILVSFLECHQRQDGSLHIPKKLRPYLQDRDVLTKRPK